MTQAVQTELTTGSPSAGNTFAPSRAGVPSAEGGTSLFEQLLAMLQNCAEGAAPVPAGATSNSPPEREEALTPVETAQCAAMMAVAAFRATTSSEALSPPTPARAPDAAMPVDAVQGLVQRKGATPLSIHTPPVLEEALPATEKPEIVVQPSTSAERQAREGVSTAEGMPTLAPATSQSVRQMFSQPVALRTDGALPETAAAGASIGSETLQPAHLTPHDAASRLSDAFMARRPDAGVQSISGIQPAVAPAIQMGNASISSGGSQAEQPDTPLATLGGTRFEVKVAGDSEAGEKPFSTHFIEAQLHGPPASEAVVAASRSLETVSLPNEVSPAEVVRQVVREMETMATQRGTSSVTLQLEPEHLGRLRVTVSVTAGSIHAHIVADNHAVRQMLESNSSLLQQALQERGLQLGALQVSVQGDGRQFLWHQPHTPLPPIRGWSEADAVWGAIAETGSGYPAARGINLLA